MIHIIIPSKKGNKEQGLKCAKMCNQRAGVTITTHVIEDLEGKGFFKIINDKEKELRGSYEWIVYCPDDYFPGNMFIKIALEEAIRSNKLFVGFNDGKWFGNNATAGMLNKKIVPLLYSSNTVFHPGYKFHGADPDLTERAKLLNQYVYSPIALLVEVDYNKDLKNLKNNPDDINFYIKRRSGGFKWEI
jgi:hypothetical protein